MGPRASGSCPRICGSLSSHSPWVRHLGACARFSRLQRCLLPWRRHPYPALLRCLVCPAPPTRGLSPTLRCAPSKRGVAERGVASGAGQPDTPPCPAVLPANPPAPAAEVPAAPPTGVAPPAPPAGGPPAPPA
jgi:hypothetical protein